MFDRTQELKVFNSQDQFVAEVKLYYKNKSLVDFKILQGDLTEDQTNKLKKAWGTL